MISENMGDHIDKELSNVQLESLWQVARHHAKGFVGEAGPYPSLIPWKLDAEGLLKEVQVKQHIFSNAGGETATEQTKLIIEVMKVITDR